MSDKAKEYLWIGYCVLMAGWTKAEIEPMTAYSFAMVAFIVISSVRGSKEFWIK